MRIASNEELLQRLQDMKKENDHLQEQLSDCAALHKGSQAQRREIIKLKSALELCKKQRDEWFSLYADCEPNFRIEKENQELDAILEDKMKDWKRIFIFTKNPPEAGNWYIQVQVADENIWDLNVHEHVCEAVPYREYLKACQESYDRGYAVAKIQILEAMLAKEGK